MAEPRGKYRNMSIFCLRCKDWQPKDNFYKNKTAPCGRASYCKLCYRAINKEAHQRRLAMRGGV